jgi:hypothetical protein
MKSEYDLYSAITFLLVGLGIGSVLAVVFNPKQRAAPEGIKLEGVNGIRGSNSWRTAGVRPQEEANERIA